MEEVTELVESGIDSHVVSESLASLSEPLEPFLDEQREKPAELKMIDSDILALASEVGDEMEAGAVSETSLADDLTFLEGAEAKEAAEGDVDQALSFLVADGKMEVNNDLDFLEGQDLSEAEADICSEEEYDEDDNESYSNEEESEAGSDEDEEDSNDKEDMENDTDDKSAKKDDDTEDDGVFGQVSFYDDESASSNSDVKKMKKKKSGKKLKVKRLKKKRKADGDTESKPSRRKRKKMKKKGGDDGEDNEEKEESDDQIHKSGTSLMRRKNIRLVQFSSFPPFFFFRQVKPFYRI